MKTFKVIENGTLNKKDMSNIVGGGLTCSSDGTTIYDQDTGGGNVSCPIKYKSCSGVSNKLTCNLEGGYNGAPGSAGIIIADNDIVLNP